MGMHIWKQYQDNMPSHTYVPCLRYILNAPQIDMNIRDSHYVNIEPKGDGALDIHNDTHYFIFASRSSFDWISTQRMKYCYA